MSFVVKGPMGGSAVLQSMGPALRHFGADDRRDDLNRYELLVDLVKGLTKATAYGFAAHIGLKPDPQKKENSSILHRQQGPDSAIIRKPDKSTTGYNANYGGLKKCPHAPLPLAAHAPRTLSQHLADLQKILGREKLTFTIARFDLDETPREPNTDRSTPLWSPLPVGFPFLVDDETGELFAPALAFIIQKCTGPRAYRERRWVKRNTADAYAADLKDWLATVASSPLAWHEADDELVDEYLLGMRLHISSHTENFLRDATIGRRRSSLNEFHKFARRRYGYKHLPIASTRNLRNAHVAGDGDETFDSFALARYDSNPRPIGDDDVPILLDALGPRPGDQAEWALLHRASSSRLPYGSSRTRLAAEVAFIMGLRVDEIVHLRAAFIESLEIDALDEDHNVEFELRITKGLVRRTVYLPVWLADLLKDYVKGERADAIAVARRHWLGSKAKPPPNLFLNSPVAGRNAGKRTTAKQLEADFHKAVMKLDLTDKDTKAAGTDREHEVEVASHTWHDWRHSFAYNLYREGTGELDGSPDRLTERRFEDVVQRIRLRLGHQHVETTINIYLRAFNREGEKALQRMSQWVRAIVARNRTNG